MRRASSRRRSVLFGVLIEIDVWNPNLGRKNTCSLGYDGSLYLVRSNQSQSAKLEPEAQTDIFAEIEY